MAFLFGKLADRKKTDAPSPDITEPPSPPPPKPKPPPPGTLLTHEDRLDLLVSDISSRAPPKPKPSSRRLPSSHRYVLMPPAHLPLSPAGVPMRSCRIARRSPSS